MCVSPSRTPSAAHRGRPDVDDRRRSAGRPARAAAAPSTGSTGCAARPAAAAGSPTPSAHTVRPPIVTLSNVCSSPTRNSSSSPGASGARRDGGEPAAQRVGVVEPVGGLRARARRAAWRRAGTRPRRRTRVRRPGSVTSWWRAHGTPAARSTSFIRALSRTLRAVSTSMPGMPSASRACASGTCSCSRAPTSRSTRPSCARQAGHRLGDLAAGRARRPPASGPRGGGPARAAPARRARW